MVYITPWRDLIGVWRLRQFYARMFPRSCRRVRGPYGGAYKGRRIVPLSMRQFPWIDRRPPTLFWGRKKIRRVLPKRVWCGGVLTTRYS